MPDNINDWRSKLRSGSTGSSAVDYDAQNNQTTRAFQSISDSEVIDPIKAQAQELKRQSKKVDEELRSYGYGDKEIKEVKKDADFWDGIFTKARQTVNFANKSLAPYAMALEGSLTDMNKKKQEILQNKTDQAREGKAIKNNKVLNTSTNQWESFDEQDLDSKTWADKFKGLFGFGTDTYGNKKLVVNNNVDSNPMHTVKNANGTYSMKEDKDKSKWVYYLDKDKDGNDVFAKTEYKNHEEFKKIADKALNAYGVTPFKTGFWREFNNELLLTYSNLEKNAVNFGEATASLTTGDGGLLGALGIKTKSGIQKSADEYRDNFELNTSKKGTGDSGLEWLGSGIGSGISSLAQMGAMGKLFGAASKLDKFRALTNFGAGSVLNFNEAYESALKAGISKEDAAKVGMLTGMINGLIESSVGSNKLVNWASGGGDRTLARSIIKELNGDVSDKGIAKVLNAWRNNSQDKIAKLFDTPILGTALEEGIEEFSQTFSQKGVENLYDIFFAGDKKVGEGKFGTEFASKESVKEALEAAFFGAIVGGGMGGVHLGLEKVSGKKHSSDNEIIPFIADGKRTQVEAMVKSLHSSKLISDVQREFYLDRINQLDELHKANEGSFATLDRDYDEKTATSVKGQALGVLNSTLRLNNSLKDLNTKLNVVSNDASIQEAAKKQRVREITEQIRQTSLNIKFNNEFLETEFHPQEDGKIAAAENKFENQEEILQNKWLRFVSKDNITQLDGLITTHDNHANNLVEELNNPENITEESAKETKAKLDRAASLVALYKMQKAANEKKLAELIDYYDQITSDEYQTKYKEKKNPTVNPLAIVNTIIVPPDMEDGSEQEENSNTQNDYSNTPVGQKEALEQEAEQLQNALADPEIQQDAAEQIEIRLKEISDELGNFDTNTKEAAENLVQYEQATNDKFRAFLDLDEQDSDLALDELKQELENMIPAYRQQGLDVTELTKTYNNVVTKLAEVKESLRLKQEEADRLELENRKSKDNDGKHVLSNSNFFNKIQRTLAMNGTLSGSYYTDDEVKAIFLNTPIEEVLNEAELVYEDASKYDPIGKKYKNFNSSVKYVNPSMIVSISYKGKKFGNLQQFDGMTVDGILLTENLTDEQFAKLTLNVSREEFELSKTRSLKLNALLKKKGKLNSEELKTLGFILNWNGEFSVNAEVGRVLIKDFKLAQLAENDGGVYIYDNAPDKQLEITEGTKNMREEPGVPPIPEGLGDRYVVLVKANNGKYYWVGAQNQVLDSTDLDKIVKALYNNIVKYKELTTEDEQKKFVRDINNKLDGLVHVAIPNANFRFTTPNKTNPNFTVRVTVGEKGSKKSYSAILNPSINPTFADIMDALNTTTKGAKINVFDRTDFRKPLANNAPVKATVNTLAINLNPTVLENVDLHKEVSYSVNDDALNSMLVEKVEEVVSPFEGYDAELAAETVVKPAVTTTDLSEYDAAYDSLSDEQKQSIYDAVKADIDALPTLKGLKLSGAKQRIKAEIAKYTTGIDPVFSIGEAHEIIDYPAAEQWIKDNLPSTISVKDINLLLGNIKNNGVTWGAFADSVIYLSQNAAEGTQYHEAFHGVFRLLLTNGQIKSAYTIAEKKYGKPTEEQIDKLRMSSTVYHGYTKNELYNLVLEEKMANEFKKFQLDILNRSKEATGLKSIWNKITNWISYVTSHRDSLNALFHNISRGSFRNATVKSNIFSSFANQEKVFDIYQKGTDNQGNIINTLQSEASGIVATLTNGLLQRLIAEKVGKKNHARRNEILDELIAQKASFYSIDENPYYESYLESIGKIEDQEFIDRMADDLTLSRNIYTIPSNIEKIKNDVFHKIKIFDIEDTVDDDELQDKVDDQGEQYDVAPWTIGGETSFSKVLREYISLTTIKKNDKYGQPYEEAVDFRKIYRGLTRALAGIEEDQILPRMASLSEFDEDIAAVFARLKQDLGLAPDNNLYTDITRNYDTWRKFVTAFNNEKVGWYTVLYSDDQARLIESNSMSNKETQFNDWFQDYIGTFEDMKDDLNLKKSIESSLDAINRSQNIKVNSLGQAKQEASKLKKEFGRVSIRLSDAYITYSLLKNADYTKLDQDGKNMLSAFAGTPGLYDNANIPFIVSEFKSGSNPFEATKDTKGKERGAVTRIKQLAEDNAIFDATIGENSFQNADGKNVYSIIRPSFGLVKLRWITDAKKRQELLSRDKKADNFIDPLENVKLNHLLADENVDLILSTLTPSMIDGMRQTSFEGDITTTKEGEGLTFGRFGSKDYLLADLMMFISNRKSLNQVNPETGTTVKLGESAMFNINQMESSNTAYGVFLPVHNFRAINDEATDILFNYFAQEVLRINKVKSDLEMGGATIWKGYNDSKEARGFKLMEFAGYGLDEYVDDITGGIAPEDIYSTLLYEKDKIVGAIKTKLENDIAIYKDVLVENDIIGEASTALPSQNLNKLGYFNEKTKPTAKNVDQLITDFYLNSYINTLGINNLMLDNYAKKVKDTVDWFKRAKGIIGSGADLGSGSTKVAVYSEPTARIKTKDLSDTEESGEDTSSIDVADAQSYVTLDHKILQLKRWGRFPAAVERVYDKIIAGLDITWDDYKVLKANNAALNSTKTVSYDGTFYFKLSELPLTPRLVGKVDADGNVIMENGMPKYPKKGFEYLFNMYHSMVKQGVDQALPASASKMATLKPAKHVTSGNFDFTGSVMEIQNKFKRLQVETPTGKLKIVHATQLIQLITNEQDDNLAIDYPYNKDVSTIGDLKSHYRKLMGDTRYEGFKQALAYIKDPLSGKFNSRELTKKFYETVAASGSDEVMTNFFLPNEKGERQFNWNLGPIINKAEQLFLSHFGEGVLKQKVAGLKVSLVSDDGIFKEDGTKLQHMVKDEDGNYYSEVMLPAFAKELLGKDPPDSRIAEVLKMFGVRIPTQDKHSMLSIKVVGFLPVEYGSVGVFPKEIVYLSGADFDIDSEFIHRKEYYEEDGKLVPYGLVTTDEERFAEYQRYELSHNKMLTAKFKELEDNDEIDEDVIDLGDFMDFTPESVRAGLIKQAFKDMGLASTLEEFVEKNPVNIASANNGMLEGQIKMLTNEHVRNGAATIPSSMTSIKSVAKTVDLVLGNDASTRVSPNTPIARFSANRNNMEGKEGIGPVAIANVVHAFLSTQKVNLNFGSGLSINGRESKGFSGDFTIDNTDNRKNDNISTLLSAMTDNAKEQLAKKLNLSYNNAPTDTLPTAAYMLALGYTMEETILFINQPAIRLSATGNKKLAEQIYKAEKALEDVIRAEFKPQNAVEYRDAVAKYKAAVGKPFTIESLTRTMNIDNFEDVTDVLYIDKALVIYEGLKEQARSVTAVSQLMQLNKGLKSTFDDNGKIMYALDKLQMNFVYNWITDGIDSYKQLMDKMVDDKVLTFNNGKYEVGEYFPAYDMDVANPDKTPFDARLQLINDPNTIQNLIIHKQVLESSKSFFLLNTDMFRMSKEFTGVPSKELIPFFMDKAYRTWLEVNDPEKFTDYQRFYDKAAYMVNKTDDNIGIDLANLKKDPKYKHNTLVKTLKYSKPAKGSKSGLIQIVFPTRIKAEGDFYTELSNGFKALFMDKATNEFAKRLFYYSYFKDGLQFRNKSFINTLPSWVFRDVSSSLDDLNDDFKDNKFDTYTSLRQGLVPTMIDLFDSLTSNDKNVQKLHGRPNNPKITKATNDRETKLTTTALNNKMAEVIDFGDKNSYIQSIESLMKVSNTESLTELLQFKRNNYSLKYNLIYQTKVTDEATAIDTYYGNTVKSIKSFDKEGKPTEYNLEQLIQYALDHKGSLPLAYEIVHEVKRPLVETAINSTLADSKLLHKIEDLKKEVSSKADNLQASPGAVDIITEPEYTEEAYNSDIFEQEDKAIEGLEISEKTSTFVNPFVAYDVSGDPQNALDLLSDEEKTNAVQDMHDDFQKDIDRNIDDQEDTNILEKRIKGHRDANNDPIC